MCVRACAYGQLTFLSYKALNTVEFLVLQIMTFMLTNVINLQSACSECSSLVFEISLIWILLPPAGLAYMCSYMRSGYLP